MGKGEKRFNIKKLLELHMASGKDLSRVKPGFKSIPLQFYFEIAGLAGAEKWWEIQNMAGEEHF